MKIHSLQSQPQVKAAELPLEQLAANPNVPESEKVGEACRQFEAVLLRQMLQEARKPVLDPKADNSTTQGIYNDMINNQLADSISRSGEVGLAKSLREQVVRQVLPQTASAQAPASNPA